MAESSTSKDPDDLTSAATVEAATAPDSTKYSTAEINTPCRFFLEGRCHFGIRCRNLHSDDAGIALHLGDHEPTQAPLSYQSSDKKPSMKTAEDVISRLLWDTQVPAEQFSIGYLDRFLGILEEPFTSFSWEDLASVGPGVLAIPKHRIHYFKYRDRIVWDKTSRTDDVFGSTGSGKTILEVIKEDEKDRLSCKEKVVEGMTECTGEEVACAGSTQAKEKWLNQAGDEHETVKELGAAVDNLNSAADMQTTLEEEMAKGITDGHSTKSRDVSGSSRIVMKGHNLMTEDGEENVALQSRDGKYLSHHKERPTHFIAIQITGVEIREAVRRFQRSLREVRPDLAKFCVPLPTLHLSLCLLRLHSPEEISKAILALRELQTSSRRLLPPALLLSFEGVGSFQSRVLHLTPASVPELELLASTLKNAFSKKDLTVIHVPGKYKFHLTMVKIPAGKAGSQLPTDLSWAPPIEDLGTQAVEALCLCEVGQGRRTDGFYTTVLKLDLY